MSTVTTLSTSAHQRVLAGAFSLVLCVQRCPAARPDCTGLFHRPAQTSPGPLGHPVLLARRYHQRARLARDGGITLVS